MAANDYAQPGFRQPGNTLSGHLAHADQPATMTAMGGARSVVVASQAQTLGSDPVAPALRARLHQNATHPSDLQPGAPNGYPPSNGHPDPYASHSRQETTGPTGALAQSQQPNRLVNGGRLPAGEYRPPVNILPQSSLESPKLLPAGRPSADNLDGQPPSQSHLSDAELQQQRMRSLSQANRSAPYPVAHSGMQNMHPFAQASGFSETAPQDSLQPRNYGNIRRFATGDSFPIPNAGQVHLQGGMRGSIPRHGSLVYAQPGHGNPSTAGYMKQGTYSGIMRLLQMGQALTSAIAQPGLAALESWSNDYFTKDAYVRFKLADNAVPIADYEIPSCTLTRFYSTLRDSGACSFQLLLDSPSEAMVGGTNTGKPHEQLVQCQNISWIVGYTSGSMTISRGKLRAIFVPTGGLGPGGIAIKMRRLEWSLSMHRELVDRDSIKRRTPLDAPMSALSPPPYAKDDPSPSELEYEGSPMKEDVRAVAAASATSRKRPRVDDEESETMRSLSAQKAQNDIRAVDYARDASYQELSLPPSIEGLGGLNPDVLQVLETGSLMDKLGELLAFSMKRNLGPIDALQTYAELCMPLMEPPIAQMGILQGPTDPPYVGPQANQGPSFPSAGSIHDAGLGTNLTSIPCGPATAAPLSV